MLAVNYEILPKHPAPPDSPVIVIADEAHRLKNPKSQRSIRFHAVKQRALAAGGRVWVLTGTPLLNLKPGELWHVLESADLGDVAFGSRERFEGLFKRRGRRVVVDSVVPQLLRRVSLMRLREDVLTDLPAKTYRTVPCEIDTATRDDLDEIVEGLKKRGLDIESDRFVEAMLSAEENREAILRDAYAAVRKNLALAKLPTLVELVEDHESQGEPLVVFSCHREPIKALGQRYGWARIMGDVTQKARAKAEEGFQAGRLAGIALTVQAGAEAITLTRGHSVAFTDLWWTPALNSQAEDRVCRIGQSRGVIVHRLVADHVLDQKVTELLDAKQQLIDDAVTASAVSEVSTDNDAVVLSFRELAEKRLQDKAATADNKVPVPASTKVALGGSVYSGVQVLLGLSTLSAFERNFLPSVLGQMRRFGGRLTLKQWRTLEGIARRRSVWT
jgi:SNF2 family DNA or RNA helicase